MAEKQPGKWSRMPKMSFSSKDLSRRMKKVEGATVKHARRFVVRRWSSFKDVRRHIAVWILAVGLLIGATGLQLFWYQEGHRTIAAANNGTYAEAVQGPVDTLNPIFARTSAEESLSTLLFSRLLAYDKSGNLNYDLAQNVSLSEDQKTYTIQLRDDARWTDGLYVGARDVVFTVNLLKNQSTRASISGWNDITVEAVDDRTVQFTLPAVYAAFPHALNFLPILPEHILRDVEPANLRENKFSTNPVGSGPFTIRFIQDLDQSEDRKIVYLTRNDTYFKGAPKLERFQLHVYEDSEAIVRALNTSEVNAAIDIPLSLTDDVRASRYTVQQTPINNGAYAIFNTGSGPLADRTVRRALQAGTNTEAVREAVGQNIPALTLPFMRDLVGGELPGGPSYNPERAAELLVEAGWELENGVRVNEDGEALRISVVTTMNPDFEKVLNALQEQWRGLGLTVTTSIADPSDPSQNFVQNVLRAREYDVLLYQLSIGGDPDVYAYWHSSQAGDGLNFSDYANINADDALSSAREVVAKNLRDAKYRTFARQWLSDAPALGLYQVTSQYVYSGTTQVGVSDQRFITPTDRYTDVRYWTVGERLIQRTP